MVTFQKIQAQIVNVCSTSFLSLWLENTAQQIESGTYKIVLTCTSTTQQSPLMLSLHSSFAALIENNEELTYIKYFRIFYTLSFMLGT